MLLGVFKDVNSFWQGISSLGKETVSADVKSGRSLWSCLCYVQLDHGQIRHVWALSTSRPGFKVHRLYNIMVEIFVWVAFDCEGCSLQMVLSRVLNSQQTAGWPQHQGGGNLHGCDTEQISHSNKMQQMHFKWAAGSFLIDLVCSEWFCVCGCHLLSLVYWLTNKITSHWCIFGYFCKEKSMLNASYGNEC